MSRVSPHALGATLYMPATRDDILDVVLGRKLPELRSVVICLEDAVACLDVETALANLRQLLLRIEAHGGRPANGPLVFVRPRDVTMAARLNDWPRIALIDGFVVPKLTLGTLPAWARAVSNPALALMPTLETREVFSPNAMVELGEAMRQTLGEQVIVVRIGGNDLMGCLGLRRDPERTLYQTPMGYVIPMLAGILGAQGFALTAPVFELMSAPRLLAEELALDIAHGLVGKTAIHPAQVSVIQDALRVSLEDLNGARLILSEAAPAVFRHNDAMCEPATHFNWATRIVERAQWHGVKQGDATSIEPVRLAEVSR
ncbi:HpcH/HpaI aldolase/citrate lyase family protein [Pseudomonas silvicola]|nr:HpcH/HpaI aldolase/citrate lyase family protein [Pseudomonas silvicola]